MFFYQLLYTQAQNLDYTGAVGRFHQTSISATNKVLGDGDTSVISSLTIQTLCRLPGSCFLNKLLDICQVVLIFSILVILVMLEV